MGPPCVNAFSHIQFVFYITPLVLAMHLPPKTFSMQLQLYVRKRTAKEDQGKRAAAVARQRRQRMNRDKTDGSAISLSIAFRLHTTHTQTPWCDSSAEQSPPGYLSTSLRRASPHLHAAPAPEYGVYGISLNLIRVVFSISEYPTQFQAADAEVACFHTQLRCRQGKSATRWQGERI